MQSNGLASPSTSLSPEVAAFYRYGIDRIGNSKIKETLSSIFDKIVEPSFWTAPASSSGKYHPTWQNKHAGLLRHTIEMLVIAPRIAEAFDLRKPNPQAHLDVILAAICLHDAFKNGRPWGKSTHKYHHSIAADVWRQVAEVKDVPPPITDVVYDAIFHHAGRWTPEGIPAAGLSPHALVVHLADMVSSSNDLGLVFEAKQFPHAGGQ